MRLKDYLLLAMLVLIDFLTKQYISSTMALGARTEVIKGFFSITHTHNTGAAWSALSGFNVLFIVAAVTVSCAILYYLAVKKASSSLQKFALILIVSGALGNLIDRMLYGYVIDFLDFIIFGYDFPVFNFADSLLTVGVALIVLDMFIVHKEHYG